MFFTFILGDLFFDRIPYKTGNIIQILQVLDHLSVFVLGQLYRKSPVVLFIILNLIVTELIIGFFRPLTVWLWFSFALRLCIGFVHAFIITSRCRF